MQTVIELGRVARDRKTLPLKVIEQTILFNEMTNSLNIWKYFHHKKSLENYPLPFQGQASPSPSPQNESFLAYP